MKVAENNTLSMTKGYKQTEVGLIPSDWEVKEFGNLTEKIVGGGTPSRSNKLFWGNEIPWVTVKDFATYNSCQTQEYITKYGLNNSSSNLIPKGIIITSTRMALGKAIIYNVDVSINQDLKAIFLKKSIDTKFFYYWFQFNSKYIEDLGSGSTVMGLSLPDLRKIKVKLPPSKTEQTAIATALSDADALISGLEKLIAKKRNIKQGAMQKLLEPKEGWEVKRLGEIFTFHSTANFSKAEMSLDGEIGCLHYGLVHAIPNVLFSLENGVRFYLNDKTTKYELIQDGDIVMVDASEDLLGINKCIESCVQ
jgi:restriction endonuclease S subunit